MGRPRGSTPQPSPTPFSERAPRSTLRIADTLRGSEADDVAASTHGHAGIFPNAAALHRLSACVLIEAHDEWRVTDRRYLSEATMAMPNPPQPTALPTAPMKETTATIKTAE